MRIFLAGATGVSRHPHGAPLLRDAGHEAAGMTRSAENADWESELPPSPRIQIDAAAERTLPAPDAEPGSVLEIVEPDQPA